MALNPLDRLVRDMEDVKRQLAGRSQLNHSSLENTAIPVYDGEGTERLRIGAQDDGTHAVVYVQGPPPPRPTAPIVSVDGPVVRVRWDGGLMGGHIPEDFSRIDVHFALASEDIEDASVVRANLATAAGSEATLMATTTGTYRVGLVAMSQSRARSEMSETVEVEVQVVDLATAIETATQSANGKNTVVYSSRSPEPTDEGTVGDTWFVNELRPRNPEDPASGVVVAIIEQWQHTGDVWVQVEMAHEVIASVDLGRAQVGFLSGERIEAGTIDTPQLAFGAATGDILAVDALNFKSARGLDIVSSSFRAGDTVEITEENGFRQYGPDGALLVSFPTDGSRNRFGGEVEATQFTATGSMSIQGPGQIAAGGQLQIESGVTAPATSPSVSATYDQQQLPPLADGDRAAHGLTRAGGLWWRWVEHEDPDASDRGRLEGINDSMEVVVTAGTGDRLGRNGLTAIGSEVFMLGPKTGDNTTRWVTTYTTSGTFVREWQYVEYGSGTYQPGIGRDEAGNLLIAQCGGTGYYRHRVYNKATGAVTGQVDGPDRPRSDFSSIYVGAADFGATRIVVGKAFKKENERQFVVYTANAQEFIREQSWYTPGRTMALAGFCWADGRFHSLTGSSTLTAYEPFDTAVQGGDESGEWWMSHTWATGSAEAPASPATRFMWPTRAQVRVTIQAPPNGADRAHLYLAHGTTEPTRTGLHRVHTATTTTVLPPVPTSWQTAPTPPATNTFTDDTPGLIRSVRGGFEVRGDGSGHWGPLTFHPDGTMSSSSVPEWIPVTTFKPGFTPQTWGYIPAYRIWPDGKVEWRGVIQGTIDVTKPILEVPPEARPKQAVNGVAATNSNVNTVRVEFKSNANPNDLTVYPVGTTRTWISLEGLFYYREEE